MTRVRVLAVAAPDAATECAVCERPIQPGRTWCSTPCRNADDSHDALDYLADDGDHDDYEMGDDQ